MDVDDNFVVYLQVDDLAETSKSITTFKTMIDLDIQAKTVRKQGSHTRNLLRVKRGLDMVKVLFEKIIATEYVFPSLVVHTAFYLSIYH